MHETRCRGCGSGALTPVLSLGDMPLANAFLSADELVEPEPRFPLDAVFCQRCALFQITETVPPDTLFREYVYLSSCSETFVAHARTLCERLCRTRSLGPDSLVVEIASNDGYLLANYVERGIPVLGVEPARNIAALAEKRGVRTLSEFFGPDLARDLARRVGRADVIHANNVLAHVPDLNGVVAGFGHLLKDDGVVVVEVPSLRDMIDRVEFDTIYHEHLCYFSLTSVDRLAARHALVIVDVEHVPVHGGTLRISLQRADRPRTVSPGVLEMLEDERRLGVDLPAYYETFAANVRAYRDNLVAVLTGLRAEGQAIAGYGASAKSTTLLQYCGIGAETLSFIVDRNALKQGRFTPGTHIPIYAPERLLADMPRYTLLLVWNFADEVLRQQAEYRRRGGRFVIPAFEPTTV
jgi:SAM-dependent methyltransferase